MRKGTFDFICRRVEVILSPCPTPVIPNRKLPVSKIVAVALFKVAHVAEYKVVRNLFGVHKSTVHNCLYSFCLALTHLFEEEYISMPFEEKACEIANYFGCKTNIPLVTPS